MRDGIHVLPPIRDDHEKGGFAMFIAGWSLVEIAKETGVNHNTVKSWSMRGKWPEKKKAIDEQRERRNPPEQQPLVRAVLNNPKGELRKQYLEKAGKVAVENMTHIADNMSPPERLELATAIAALGKHDRDNLDLNKDQEAGEKSHISLHFLTSADKPGFVKIIKPEKIREIEDKPNDEPA